jgi:hypothetical protein
LVVLNSLRLVRLGRDGIDRVHAPALTRGLRGLVVPVLLPVVLFAGLVGISQAISPARGQSVLPTLPSLQVRSLPDGGSVESYLDPGGTGVNQFHLIFSGTPHQIATVDPVVTATTGGGAPQPLRQIKVSAGHFSEIVVLSSGTWHFHVTTHFGDTSVHFTVETSVH